MPTVAGILAAGLVIAIRRLLAGKFLSGEVSAPDFLVIFSLASWIQPMPAGYSWMCLKLSFEQVNNENDSAAQKIMFTAAKFYC